MKSAVIVAGGTGSRFAPMGGKQMAGAGGKPVLAHTLLAFERCADVVEIVLVAHPERTREYAREAAEPYGISKLQAVVPGGRTRQRSVAAGLEALSPGSDIVVVHDGARPLVTPRIISGAIAALEQDADADGVVVGHPAYDTMKVVDESSHIRETPDRDMLWVAQTPQVFRTGFLKDVYREAEEAGFTGTDDAALVTHAGGRVRMLLGPRDNIKVTVPEDLKIVEGVLRLRVSRGD